MVLVVEVVAVGVCRAPSSAILSYSAFIVSVQQDAYQGWTIYRRYQSFVALYEHLKLMVQPQGLISVPQLPLCDPNNFQVGLRLS